MKAELGVLFLHECKTEGEQSRGVQCGLYEKFSRPEGESEGKGTRVELEVYALHAGRRREGSSAEAVRGVGEVPAGLREGGGGWPVAKGQGEGSSP